jgi:hypothetical protein
MGVTRICMPAPPVADATATSYASATCSASSAGLHFPSAAGSIQSDNSSAEIAA